MNKQEVYALLQAKQLHFEITEHPAVYTMAELADVPCPYPDADAKSLFVRDDKKQHYYLLTVQGNKRVDLKAFRKAQQTRPLTFASSEELLDKLRLPPGAVTPLGLLNSDVHEVTAYFDEELLRQYRTNELVRWRMHFLSDAIAEIEGLLEVNRDFCKKQMAEKASPALPTNCAVLP